MRRALLLALSLCACSSLPLKPDPPHHFFEHADHFVTVNAPALYPKPVRVRFKDVGQGPVLLLVHGLQTSAYSWRYNLEALGEHHRVIALDLVGSGLSDHPADFGYAPEHMAAFLEAFRSAVGIDRWDVVGNSLGGVYTAAYASLFPEHLNRLVIIHAPGFMEEAPFFGLEQLRRGRVPQFMSFLFGPWLVRSYQRYYRPGMLSEEEVDQYALPFADSDGRHAYWHIVRDGLGPERVPDLAPLLAKIRAPTLLVWATRDSLIPSWTGYRWEQAIPKSRLVWIDESSHFPHVEAPRTTERLLLEFLDTPAPQ